MKGNSEAADCAAVEQEVARCRSALYPAALQLTGNQCDAEDLVQETMVRAYAGLRNFTPGTNARAWLRRIMVNAFVNVCRKRRREVVHVLRSELDLSWQDGDRPAVVRASSARSAEEEVLGQFAHSECRRAVEELPESFRAVVYFADVEGYCLADVAALTGAPIGTVMSRLHRARARLRKRLSGVVSAESAA